MSLLLTAAWVAALPSLPPCLTETVCTKLGGCACPVATWHMYSPESETCNNNNVTIYGQESRRVCEGCTFISHPGLQDAFAATSIVIDVTKLIDGLSTTLARGFGNAALFVSFAIIETATWKQHIVPIVLQRQYTVAKSP